MDYLDITAKALGFSRSTVCRAIARSRYVSRDTQKCILDYIRLHFPEKLENRRLQENADGNAKKTIAVIMPCKPQYFWNMALEGMRDAVRRCASSEVNVRYDFFSGNISEAELLNILDDLALDKIDALILVPVDGERISERLSEISEKIPVVFFNEYCHCDRVLSVLTDGYREGEAIAEMILPNLKDDDNVLLLSTVSYKSRVIVDRIRGFTEAIRKAGQTKAVNLSFSTLNMTDSDRADKYQYHTIIAAIFARTIAEKMAELQLSGRQLDAVYVPNGELDPLLNALRKLKCQHISAYGHEISPQAHEFFMDGYKGGYVKQDIYEQGKIAMESIIAMTLRNEKPTGDTVITHFDSCQFK